MSVDFDVVLGCFDISNPANCCVTDRMDADAIMRVYAEGDAGGKGVAESLKLGRNSNKARQPCWFVLARENSPDLAT